MNFVSYIREQIRLFTGLLCRHRVYTIAWTTSSELFGFWFYFSLFFSFLGRAIDLAGWPSRQFLSARKSTVSYRIVSCSISRFEKRNFPTPAPLSRNTLLCVIFAESVYFSVVPTRLWSAQSFFLPAAGHQMSLPISSCRVRAEHGSSVVGRSDWCWLIWPAVQRKPAAMRPHAAVQSLQETPQEPVSVSEHSGVFLWSLDWYELVKINGSRVRRPPTVYRSNAWPLEHGALELLTIHSKLLDRGRLKKDKTIGKESWCLSLWVSTVFLYERSWPQAVAQNAWNIGKCDFRLAFLRNDPR